MNRRTLLQALVLPFVVPARKLFAATKEKITQLRGPLRVHQIIPVAFAAVKKEFKGEWLTDEMNFLESQGRVKFMSLGSRVDAPIATETGIETRSYDIKEITVPMVWSEKDDLANTEEQKINLCTSLIENALMSMEDIIAMEMKDEFNIVVSKEYHCSCGDVMKCTDEDGEPFYVCKIYTALAFIPRALHGESFGK